MSEDYRNFVRAAHINWQQKATVDSLTEAMHYFSDCLDPAKYNKLELIRSIKASKGIVCNVIDAYRNIVDPLGYEWNQQLTYYQLYNRKYLERPNSLMFERVPKGYLNCNWQTVHKHIVEQAASDRDKVKCVWRRGVTIAVIMMDKTIWYIEPKQFQRFSYEWETERIPYNEFEPECSIPLNQTKIISQVEPFGLSKR